MSEQSQIISISASKIKLAFEDCYGKYYFRYVKKLPVQEVVWPGTTLGEIIHKYIENSIEAINNSVKLEDFKKSIVFEKIFSEYLANYKKHNKVFKYSRDINKKDFLIKGQKYSELFVKFIYGFIESEKNENTILRPEYKIEFTKDNIRTSGIIDLFVDSQAINKKVIDFKTTGDWHKWFYVDWKNDIQSIMYLYLIYESMQAFVNQYDYLILDHNKKIIFFKGYSYTHEEIIDKIESLKRIIYKLVQMHLESAQDLDKKFFPYFKPEKTKWFFCDFKDNCNLKVI